MTAYNTQDNISMRESLICSEYNKGFSANEVAKRNNIPRSEIYRTLRKFGIKRRSGRSASKSICSIDDNFFENINTHEKAQILGFIFADGCISKRTKNSKRLQITLKLDDKDYLDWIRSVMKSNCRIRVATYNCKDGRIRNIASFTSSSPKIVADLEKYGVVERKSLVIGFPSEEVLSKEYWGSFIRGVFEGDGSIYIPPSLSRKNRCADVGIAATINFNQKLADILSSHFGIKSYLSFPKCMIGKNFCILRIGTVESVMRFYDLIYANAIFKMERKHQRFLAFKERYDSELNHKFDLRSSSVEAYVKSPNGQIFHFNTATDFAKEMNLCPSTMCGLGRGRVKTHKGWTLATSEEIESAKTAGSVIEKMYRVPQKVV